jgi:surface polysaccharide O-acyltransferase-like enzyme
MAGQAVHGSSAQLAVKSSHIKYLDLFRAVAIFQVVMIHAGNALLQRGVAQSQGDNANVHAALHILVHDSTIYFAMISGILYGHLFSKRDHGPFLKARFVNTGSPYFVVTVALTILFTLLAWWRGEVIDTLNLLRVLVVDLVTGDVWNTMWYIPLILVLYAVSPLLFALVRDPRWRWLAIIVALLPLVFSRSGTDLTPSMFVYFAGVYIIGLAIGARLERSIDWLSGKTPWLWATSLGTTALLIWLFATGIEFIGPTSVRESVFYVQRLALGSLMLVGLRVWSRAISSSADHMMGMIAAASFGIYFVHGPLLRPIARAVGMFVPTSQPWWALTGAILVTFALGLSLSLALVYVVRWVSGPHSRKLVGA